MEEKSRPDNSLTEPTITSNPSFQKLIEDYIKYLNNQRSSGNWLPYLISVAIFLILIYGLANGVFSLVRPWMISQQTSPPVTPNNPPTTTSPTPEPTPSATPNPFQSVTFPQDVCGDKLPDDATAYPVSLYPIFVKYTEANLAKIKSDFCQDAFKKFRDKNNRDEIQVGSFLGTERASQFKEFLAQTFVGVDIGEVTIIEAKRETPTTLSTPSPPPIAQVPSSKATFRDDQAQFQTLTIQCGLSPGSQINFGDLEITCKNAGYSGTFLSIKNYSSDWYEIQMDSRFITEPLASVSTKGMKYLLVPPGSTSDEEITQSKNFSFQAKKILGDNYPSTKITVNCDDQPIHFWNIAMKPKCTSEGGIFIDLYTVVGNATVSLDTGDGTPLVFEPSLIGQSGWISYDNSKIDITFYVGRKE